MHLKHLQDRFPDQADKVKKYVDSIYKVVQYSKFFFLFQDGPNIKMPGILSSRKLLLRQFWQNSFLFKLAGRPIGPKIVRLGKLFSIENQQNYFLFKLSRIDCRIIVSIKTIRETIFDPQALGRRLFSAGRDSKT